MSTTCKIQPIILCGGQGQRLWPISTSLIPKQFISLGEKGTLLEETLRRISLVMKKCEERGYMTYSPILVMNKNHKLPSELSMHEPYVLYENYGNDTAVAVARSVLEIKRRYSDKNIIMLVIPADHYIYNVESFIQDIADGITHVNDNNIVLYGIDPNAPETKYGYIIPSQSPGNKITFREKPSIEMALELIKQNALWNSGIFAANIDLILQCLISSRYNIMDWIDNPRDGKAPSFDVAVLQEYDNIYAHHCNGWRWSDIGTWDAFTNTPEIKKEMLQSNDIIMSDCNNTNVLKRSPGNIVIIGCDNLLVVTSSSDLLIMSNKGDYNNRLKEIANSFNK
jgi:mannose-1-phosphate guanylyltransferase